MSDIVAVQSSLAFHVVLSDPLCKTDKFLTNFSPLNGIKSAMLNYFNFP